MADLYNGKVITSWMDEGFVHIGWGLVTFSIPVEDFESFCRELGYTYAKFKEEREVKLS